MPISARRNSHIHSFVPENSSNLALRICRHNKAVDEQGEYNFKEQALNAMSTFHFPSEALTAYNAAYKKLQQAVISQEDCLTFEIETTTRVLLGTGNASVFEFGFNLNHPWGVPYITGTTLKGAVSSYLSRHGGEQWSRDKNNNPAKKSDAQVELFGGISSFRDETEKSYIGALTFHDAWLTPWRQHDGRGDWFEPDIITPHYRGYYNRERMPDGMDNPMPIKIAALRPGLRFMVTIQGPMQYCEFAKKVLTDLLRDEGLGGKTAAGYGRFRTVLSDREKLEEGRTAIAEAASPQELLSVHEQYGSYSDLHNVFASALGKIEYAPDLENMWRTYRPLGYLLTLVSQKKIKSLNDLNKRFNKELKAQIARWKTASGIEELRQTDEAQELFKVMYQNWYEDVLKGKQLKIVQELSFSWEDTDYSAQELMDIAESDSWAWPPLGELAAYVQNNAEKFEDEETRELILLALE